MDVVKRSLVYPVILNVINLERNVGRDPSPINSVTKSVSRTTDSKENTHILGCIGLRSTPKIYTGQYQSQQQSLYWPRKVEPRNLSPWARISFAKDQHPTRISEGERNDIPISIAQIPVPVPRSSMRRVCSPIGARYSRPPRAKVSIWWWMSRRSFSL